jgi:PAS domain S-box-containing protein
MLEMFSEIGDSYRQSYLAADIKQAKLGVLLLTLPLVLFFYNDYLFFSLSFEFYFLTAARIGLIAYTVLFFAYLGRIKHSRQYYRSAFAWGLAGIAFQLLINSSRPESFLFHVIMVIILTFANCLVIPQTFVNRIILSLTLTIGELTIIVMGMPSVAVTALFSVVFSLVLANLIGLSMSRLMESYRVKAFINQENLVESEKKYREFADSLPEIAFEAEDSGKVTFANKNASKVLGYLAEEFEQMNIMQFIAPASKQKVTENFENILQGKLSDGNEYSVLKKDGSSFPVISFSEKTISKEGKIGIRGIMVNIAERKRAEEKLELLNEKLRVVGSLTRHDVGNKLMVVKSNVYLIKRQIGDNPKLASYLEGIDSALTSSDRIFEFSRLYEKIGAEQPSNENVAQCFSQAKALLPNLGTVTVVNDCKGLEVVADSLLKQLFYNFLDNSVKHGEKVTQIRLHYTKEGDELKLFYEDDGVGIPEANKPKLFDAGFTTGKGSGLGLYLIKKMMDVYGWEIEENGEPGKGAKFIITIPKLNKSGKENYQIT